MLKIQRLCFVFVGMLAMVGFVTGGCALARPKHQPRGYDGGSQAKDHAPPQAPQHNAQGGNHGGAPAPKPQQGAQHNAGARPGQTGHQAKPQHGGTQSHSQGGQAQHQQSGAQSHNQNTQQPKKKADAVRQQNQKPQQGGNSGGQGNAQQGGMNGQPGNRP